MTGCRYYFGSGGKLTRDTDKKKVNGRYYYFNEHGQMLLVDKRQEGFRSSAGQPVECG
ncbi:MAG: hypothetical protein ACLUOI_35430 [Eisenbergiella sp.]